MRPDSLPEDHSTKPRGRPRVESKMNKLVSARIPAARYRQLADLAEAREIPLSTLVRELLCQSGTDEYSDPAARWRRHKYVGGPPSKRLRTMQSNHEVRARRFGVQWEIIDLRAVYRHHKGICGICQESVKEDVFTIDHIVPLSRGGPHLFANLQPAHAACNSRKGDT